VPVRERLNSAWAQADHTVSPDSVITDLSAGPLHPGSLTGFQTGGRTRLRDNDAAGRRISVPSPAPPHGGKIEAVRDEKKTLIVKQIVRLKAFIAVNRKRARPFDRAPDSSPQHPFQSLSGECVPSSRSSQSVISSINRFAWRTSFPDWLVLNAAPLKLTSSSIVRIATATASRRAV